MEIGRQRIMAKPWGHEEIFASTDRYVGKLLCIRAGEALSLQYHRRKDETLRVLEGRLALLSGPDPEQLDRQVLEAGAIFHVRPGSLHRLEALSDCRLVEVSTPELDDVVRIEDRYGRKGTSDP